MYLKPSEEAKTKKILKLKKTVYELKGIGLRAWYKSVVGPVQVLGKISGSLDPIIFKMEKV